ncbi:MAG: hypothetical protein HOV92_22245 [Streptomyces sp.]|nr:hypothetical protein [Streptomyces sp.]NUS86408.1 hypothetical protein [Streptomyces sp.]
MPYTTWNGPAPTTAALASVTTGTAIKTMLQLATPASRMIQILEWGFSLDDPPGADGVIELLQTDVAATVTAHVAAGVFPLDPNGTASLLTLGTSATGYTASAEGTITATRPFDAVSLSSVSGESGLSYVRTFMPDDRPIVAVSKFLRIRATTPTTASDMRCFITFQEVG